MKHLLFLLALLPAIGCAEKETDGAQYKSDGVTWRKENGEPLFKYAGPTVAGFEITPMVDNEQLGILIEGNFIPVEDCWHFKQFKKDYPEFRIPKSVIEKFTCK